MAAITIEIGPTAGDWAVLVGQLFSWNDFTTQLISLGQSLTVLRFTGGEESPVEAHLSQMSFPSDFGSSLTLTIFRRGGVRFSAAMETGGTITFSDSSGASLVTDVTEYRVRTASRTAAYTLSLRGEGLTTAKAWFAAFNARRTAATNPSPLTITFTDGASIVVPDVANQAVKRGASFSLTLPESDGGPSTVYTASPLPSGLVFDATTRVISGIPTGTGTTTVTYTATAGSLSSEVTFDIVVSATPAMTLGSVANQSATHGDTIDLLLPEANGGYGAKTYSAAPLPAGLAFNAMTRRITGRAEAGATVTVSYSAQDSDPVEADRRTITRTFTFAVADTPTLAMPEVADQTVSRGSAVSISLPEATGGLAPLTYMFTGTLPAGLTYDEDEREITGVPSAEGTASLTYTVTDSRYSVARVVSRSFDLTVNPPAALSLPDPDDQEAYVGDTINLQLPAPAGGIAPVTLTASPLPDGLSFAPDSRRITGIPTNAGMITVTYQVEDSDSPAATVSQTFAFVINPTVALEVVPDAGYTRDASVSLVLPTATGGVGDITYTADPLPVGLAFDADTRTISGTASRAQSVTVRYRATDENGRYAERTFSLKVHLPPTLGSVSNKRSSVGEAVNIQLPTATGGSGGYTYATTALPEGLTFTPGTRRITGEPTELGAKSVTYTVTDSVGGTAQRTFTYLIVNFYVLPAVEDQRFTRGSGVNILLPAATGGQPPYFYSATPLPSGLAFNGNTRRISGTVDTAQSIDVVYTVGDSGGFPLSRTFNFRVFAPPTFNDDADDREFYVGRQVNLQLPAASGGSGGLVYSISALPSGLEFTAATRRVTGTPNTPTRPTMRYTVTDSVGGTDELTFELAIAAAPPPLTLRSPGALSARIGNRFTRQLAEATGGIPPYTYTVSGLPDGLTFEPKTRVVTGVPTREETPTATYRVTDSESEADSTTFVVTVIDPPDTATYRLEVDWDGDGTFGHRLANVWDDVRSLRTERGKNFNRNVFGRAEAGLLKVELRNDTGRYLRFNSESPLNGLVVPGKRVRLRMRTSRTSPYLTIWGGQLFEIESDPEVSGNDSTSFDCRGPLQDLTQREISVPMQTGERSPSEGATTYDPPNAHHTADLPQVENTGAIAADALTHDGRQYVALTGPYIDVFRRLGQIGSAHRLGRLPTAGTRKGLCFHPDNGVFVSVMGDSIEVWTAENPAGATTRAIGSGGTGDFVGICWDGEKFVLVRDDRTIWHFSDETNPSADIATSGSINTAFDQHTPGGIEHDGAQYLVSGVQQNRKLLVGFPRRDQPGAASRYGLFGNTRIWDDGDLCWDKQRLVASKLRGGTETLSGATVQLYGMAVLPPTVWSAARETISVAQAVKLVLDAAHVPDWQRGPVAGERQMVRWWSSNQRALEALRELEETEGGTVVETNDGRISLEAENSRVGGQATYLLNADGVSDIPVEDVTLQNPAKDVVNIVRVPVRNFDIGPVEVIWQLAQTLALAAKDTVTFAAEYPPPSNPAAAVGIDQWIPLAETIDYQANDAADGTGANRTSDLAILTEDTATSRALSVRNSGDTALVITRLQTRGRVLTEAAPTVIEVGDPVSIFDSALGDKTYPVPAQFVSNIESARSYASFLLGQLKEPPIRVEATLEMSDHLEAAQTIDLSDRISLQLGGARDEMFVEKIQHQITPGQRHYLTLLLSGTGFIDNLFILGESRLGVGVLGR